jgi:hypothetical protein
VVQARFLADIMTEINGRNSGAKTSRAAELRFLRILSYVHDDFSLALLVDGYRSFNLVRYGGRIFGLRQTLGPVSLCDSESLRNIAPEDLVIGDSLSEVRARIDLIELGRVTPAGK